MRNRSRMGFRPDMSPAELEGVIEFNRLQRQYEIEDGMQLRENAGGQLAERRGIILLAFLMFFFANGFFVWWVTG